MESERLQRRERGFLSEEYSSAGCPFLSVVISARERESLDIS